MGTKLYILIVPAEVTLKIIYYLKLQAATSYKSHSNFLFTPLHVFTILVTYHALSKKTTTCLKLKMYDTEEICFALPLYLEQIALTG